MSRDEQVAGQRLRAETKPETKFDTSPPGRRSGQLE